jgi:hypothetical protein
MKADRLDRRYTRNQSGKRKVVVIVRERGGTSVPVLCWGRMPGRSNVLWRLRHNTDDSRLPYDRLNRVQTDASTGKAGQPTLPGLFRTYCGRAQLTPVTRNGPRSSVDYTYSKDACHRNPDSHRLDRV